MSANLKYVAGAIAILIVCWHAYDTGYEKAQTEGELAIEQLKLTHAQEIINAQQSVRVEYEDKVKTLSDDLNRARELNSERLRQLSKFNSTSRDLETCTRERRKLGELAIRGEDLLYRADSYLRALGY